MSFCLNKFNQSEAWLDLLREAQMATINIRFDLTTIKYLLLLKATMEWFVDDKTI